MNQDGISNYVARGPKTSTKGAGNEKVARRHIRVRSCCSRSKGGLSHRIKGITYLPLFHLVITARRACSLVRALAFPLPALPPRRPRATACRFFFAFDGITACIFIGWGRPVFESR